MDFDAQKFYTLPDIHSVNTALWSLFCGISASLFFCAKNMQIYAEWIPVGVCFLYDSGWGNTIMCPGNSGPVGGWWDFFPSFFVFSGRALRPWVCSQILGQSYWSVFCELSWGYDDDNDDWDREVWWEKEAVANVQTSFIIMTSDDNNDDDPDGDDDNDNDNDDDDDDDDDEDDDGESRVVC